MSTLFEELYDWKQWDEVDYILGARLGVFSRVPGWFEENRQRVFWKSTQMALGMTLLREFLVIKGVLEQRNMTEYRYDRSWRGE